LNQDDFRKLLATPRPPRHNDSDGSAIPITAPKRNAGAAIFAQPRSMRKKNFNKAKKEEEIETVPQTPYRDRAAERRQQELAAAESEAPVGFSVAKAADDYSQLSTEELLKRTQAERDQELDAKQLYEQSKYLGGDVDHTHLVKGLDYALLQKVRKDLEHRNKEKNRDTDEEMEDGNDNEDEELDDHAQDDTLGLMDKRNFRTVMARNIVEIAVQQSANDKQMQRTDLFESGRMAYVFELADEVGNYTDPFAIPTSVIRSKADMAAKISSRGGWSEENQSEADFVIEKVSQVMAGVRRGKSDNLTKHQQAATLTKATQLISEPVAMSEDGFDGDIFADVGRDYQLDESHVSTTETSETLPPATKMERGGYFQGLANNDDDEMAEAADAATDNAVNALLTKATRTLPTKKMKYSHDNDVSAPISASTSILNMDADEADIDMFGLSSSALPTSFEEHKRAVAAYESGDSSDNDEENENDSATQMMDQGTNRNKKAQLTRWDFDTEEEWQKYKDSIEIHPKSAFQFGVKLGDGRKRNRERKGMTEKQKLDREYQKVKNIMSQKYGKTLDK
ncbi:RED-like protein N-terminal region-domain-containing protein, partial [Mycotypha africana]|uniref:RED-like protein N-terminal region-domain-containing protein n=1 Tax=Mycotypha africana TaxID=64632 RepID=UPI00230037E9